MKDDHERRFRERGLHHLVHLHALSALVPENHERDEGPARQTRQLSPRAGMIGPVVDWKARTRGCADAESKPLTLYGASDSEETL